MKVARIYLRVSTDEQDLTRQAEIEHGTRSAGYYIAGVYREKASGARADRPKLLRMIADLQPGDVVVAEKIAVLCSSRHQMVGANVVFASASTIRRAWPKEPYGRLRKDGNVELWLPCRMVKVADRRSRPHILS